MRGIGEDFLLGWPVGPSERAAQIERDPRTRAEVFADLFDVTKELRRLRARLEYVEDENARLRLELARASDDDDADDDDDDAPLELVRKS